MKGRNAQPLSVLQATGKKHLTKKEIEQRKESEIKIGSDELICPEAVKNDLNAFKKWTEIMRDYDDAKNKGIEIIKSSDIGILERYCKTYSRILTYEDKLKHARKIERIIELENLINKLNDANRKDEDRLFLNPLAKVKNVPKKEKDKPNNPMEDEYGI